MLVSILIPTKDRRRFLEEALASARAQTHDEVEILVSDDGSKDGSLEMVKEVARVDSRVRLLVGNPRPGIFSNINFGLASARGEAVVTLGDDDRLDPTFVERLVAPLIADSTVVASFSDHRIIDAAGTVLEAASLANSSLYGRSSLPEGVVADGEGIALGQSICLGWTMVRANIFQARSFDETYGGAADWELAFRLVDQGNVHYVAEVLGDYRVHPGTATQTKRLFMLRGSVKVLAERKMGSSAAEERRRRMLRHAAGELAFEESFVSREAARRAFATYREAGGTLLSRKAIAAIALMAAPRAVSRRLLEARDRLRSSRKTRS